MAQRVICSARVYAHALAGTQSYKDSKKIGKCKGKGKFGGGVIGRMGNASLDGGASLDRVDRVDGGASLDGVDGGASLDRVDRIDRVDRVDEARVP